MSILERLRKLGSSEKLTADDVFDAIFMAGSDLSDSDRESDGALEIAIRLLEARRVGQVPDGCKDAIEYLAEECGLYPYIDPANFGHLTRAVIEAHAVDLHEKVYLHSKQMQVLLWLLAGDNVILSAPTSFGKSLLVDALLARSRPHTVVMILPTIALIDEARRRLISRFGSDYDVLTSASDSRKEGRSVVFVLTQERFLQRDDVGDIDLLFVDEFYKLDPDRQDARFETLNLALYRALPRARQCFMAGPHIQAIELGQQWNGNFRFIKTDYRTVTVNIIDRRTSSGRLAAFLADVAAVGAQSSLVFTASPPSAEKIMGEIVQSGISYPSKLSSQFGDWIERNYHPGWVVADGCRHGVVVHHGRIPRALGQLFVQLFDRGQIKVLICTSTLIEGVNTSAANVFVYDKKINRDDFDFFSFANIRGRVGRMMRHFIGNAYLYHEPPDEVETSVDVPVFSDPGGSTDFLVMNVDRESLSPAGQERQRNLPAVTGLSETILREHGAIGVELLLKVFERVKDVLRVEPEKLIWARLPDYEQKKVIAELALVVVHGRKQPPGLHTGAQVAWAWNQLQKLRQFRSFLEWFVRTFHPEDREKGLDAAFQFLQACEFAFPRAVAAIEALVAHAKPEAQVSYGLFVSSLENWFRPQWMKELDEAGIPIPLAERLQPYIGIVTGKSEAMARLGSMDLAGVGGLDVVDLYVIKSALNA
ncbi:hypothetical protein D7W82_29280 [Corallococcus sp. CA049B]|uniref:DEAD/DEAH box helicase n=1 Tax=Corallococcus sp. CA049B TaxID=2316730 RepID=UPI000EA2B341|nr:DEAD/DEAH box helicase [Corallococcus sp. CA049B]RKG80471.1 hypothetical protein D7W82_29280 [Corallococcus sp. CA049B]